MEIKRFCGLGMLVLSSCLFVSCVDEKYDLNDVDMTLGTSSDLTLPTSSTGEIILKNIVDLENDGVVQAIDGEYFLIEDGSADVPNVTVDPITVTSPSLDGFKAFVSVDKLVSNSRTDINRVTNAGMPLDQTYLYTIKEEDKAHYKIDVSSGIISEDIVSLTSVDFVDGTTLDAQIKITFDKEHAFINKVHLDDLKVTIPMGLHVAHAEFRHWTEIDGKVVLKDEEAKVIDNDKGEIIFTYKDVNTVVDENHAIDVLITFDKAITGNDGFVFANNKVSLNGIFKLDGTFRLETSDFDESALTDEQKTAIYQSGSYDVIRPDMIGFDGGASFNKDIVVKSFAGKIISNVGDVAPIKLDNMPDFINDPETCLDLANPAFFVEVNNTLPADASTSVTLTSKYLDGTASVSKSTGIFVLPANKHVVFCLANNPEQAVIPEQFTSLERINITIENLSELLLKVPNEIRVDVSDVTMETDNMPIPIDVPKEYSIGVNYKVYTPLEFGPSFKLVYQGTEEGIAEDLEDINKMDTKAVRIDANVVTDFPLDLTLSVDALSRDNVSLKGKIIDVDDVHVYAHKEGAGPTSTQPVSLTILPKKGHTIRELLEQMDKLHYRAVAEAKGTEGKLKENASIKLTDIKITLLGGVSYDAN